MKKYILLLFLVLVVSAVCGCMFNEEDVPDPIPLDKPDNTPLDATDNKTLVGKYSTNEIRVSRDGVDISSEGNLYTSYLNGFINFNIAEDNLSLEYNYGLQYIGYKEVVNYEYITDKEYKIINGFRVEKDNRTIILDEPIKFSDSIFDYTITSLQKFDDKVIDLNNGDDVSKEITNYSPTLCDPQTDECQTIDEAMKYIGYYRIESLTCDNQPYTGGTDFAGEMVASASLGNQVKVPIQLKIQIKNDTLKGCFLKTEEQERDVYVNTIEYSLPLTVAGELQKVFELLGLNGLKNESDPDIRHTQIDYLPKTEGDYPNYDDMLFGDDDKNVTMRLKIIRQGSIDPIPTRKLDDKPYF